MTKSDRIDTSPQTSENRVHNRAGVGLLTFSHVVNDLYQGAVPAIIPFLVAEYHYNYLAVTGITLAATFISSVAQPASGCSPTAALFPGC
jgi:FSR family fosmidomycin resistance protein-like MFS transporter